MIELTGITKYYQMGENRVNALDGVDITIEDRDFIAIMGPSGSGKSTLMHILGLLDVPCSGSYRLGGREVSGLSEDELAILRREEIGFIFQQFNLLPRLNAVENVALPLLYSSRFSDFGFPMELLGKVGLSDRYSHRPNELSGGQQQRVAIARSLTNRPRMILADEPTGNLDSSSEKEIMRALRELNEQGITIIIVTHEEDIGRQAKRLVRMRDGKIQSDERIGEIKKPDDAEGSLKKSKARSMRFRRLWEHFLQGIRTLMSNKVRTGLSMLGILIGVAAVVAMLAIGRGAQKQIESQLSSLGSNLLILQSGSMRPAGVSMGSNTVTRLKVEDAEDIAANISGLREVAPVIDGRVQITYKNKNWNSTVIGTTPNYVKIHDSKVESGHIFSEDDNKKRRRLAVIGKTVIGELFGEKNPIGEMIKINKVNFLVTGVLPEKGSSGFRDQDDLVIIPIETALHRLLGRLYIKQVEIEVADAKDLESAQDRIFDLMIKNHKVPKSQEEDAFTIRNLADIQNALSASSRVMSLLLASIAAISLLVGGIGIMNIMLVSVTERTKEIGLRKAIGAKRGDILLQFLIESVVISAAGGILGIALGWSITALISMITGWPTSVSADSVLLSFFFSATIGIVFGIYPARKASILNPIDALRYE
ncbi:MAG: ABC transporter permease [Oligoflexales bacterium]|nr:ABC transporter permease [Oligoflexales bacterium]